MNLSEPLVSLIMPCYNAGAFVGEAVKSVLGQTYSNLELIIVNDGSSDHSDEVIRQFDDPRVRYFVQENKGQCAASNFGAAQASGDYIKFFDADDVLNPRHIEAQLAALSGSTSDMASCAWGRFYDHDPDSAVFTPETEWKNMDSLSWLKAALSQKYEMLGACLWLIPKEILKAAGGWDERLSLNNDFEFSIRLLAHCNHVRFASEARLYYRAGSADSLSQNYAEAPLKAAILSTELGCEHLLRMENSPETRRICANHFQKWLFRIYPGHPALQQYLNAKIKALGGSDRQLEGGRVARMFIRTIGWKRTSRLRRFLQQVGYQKLPGN